jgi:hypothetical protein
MQFHPAKLALIAACMLLPACAAKKAPDTTGAQIWAEMEFDRLSWKYEGTSNIVLLNTCYDLYGFLNEDYIDFEGVLECYEEQVADMNSAPEETGPRDLRPKSERDASPKPQVVESQ